MLERFFVKPQTVDRIRGSWLGSNIEFYVTELCEKGYSARSIYRRVPLLMQFGAFTEALEIRNLDEAEKVIEPFLGDWLSRRRNLDIERQRQDRNFARPVLNQFFCIVARQSDYHRFRVSLPEPFGAVVPGFFGYLRDERGLRTTTLERYRYYLRRFEAYLLQIDCTNLATLSLPVVTGFITTSAEECHHRTMTILASVLRVFLRYLRREGVVQQDLSKLVETPQHYRLADIPRSIGWDAVRRMLEQVDRRTAVGRRDYAMLLLMVTYGLRAREVAALTLDDIDWKRDRLHVRERKADHTTVYPLAPAIGEAIVVRRLRFSGQWDKLRAGRSKEA
ncbi:MAG: site-specific integrase [Rhodopila sp.]|jgi:site-specific recombinase XerD